MEKWDIPIPNAEAKDLIELAESLGITPEELILQLLENATDYIKEQEP